MKTFEQTLESRLEILEHVSLSFFFFYTFRNFEHPQILPFWIWETAPSGSKATCSTKGRWQRGSLGSYKNICSMRSRGFQFLDGANPMLALPRRISKKRSGMRKLTRAKCKTNLLDAVKSSPSDARLLTRSSPSPPQHHQHPHRHLLITLLHLLFASHVSAAAHGAVLVARPQRPRGPGVGLRRQVRRQLPGQVRRGALRPHARLRAHRAGRLRLLPGVRGRPRGALLPHRVRHARRQVRTGPLLRVLQGRGRLRGWIRRVQRYRFTWCVAPKYCRL